MVTSLTQACTWYRKAIASAPGMADLRMRRWPRQAVSQAKADAGPGPQPADVPAPPPPKHGAAFSVDAIWQLTGRARVQLAGRTSRQLAPLTLRRMPGAAPASPRLYWGVLGVGGAGWGAWQHTRVPAKPGVCCKGMCFSKDDPVPHGEVGSHVC